MSHYKNLDVYCIDLAYHLKTCGYWYLVKENNAAHTAFRTKEALIAWLDMLGLKLDSELPEEIGTFKRINITGEYCTKTVSDITGLAGEAIYHLSNADYTTGMLFSDNGLMTISYVGPNGSRQVHDYFYAQNQIQSGNFFIGAQS